jgi:hypothetical protein
MICQVSTIYPYSNFRKQILRAPSVYIKALHFAEKVDYYVSPPIQHRLGYALFICIAIFKNLLYFTSTAFIIQQGHFMEFNVAS